QGIDPFLNVLESQQRALDGRSAYLTARHARIENRIALHLALGGGFEQYPIATGHHAQDTTARTAVTPRSKPRPVPRRFFLCYSSACWGCPPAAVAASPPLRKRMLPGNSAAVRPSRSVSTWRQWSPVSCRPGCTARAPPGPASASSSPLPSRAWSPSLMKSWK